MINVKYFTFSPFAENTYILYDETKDCLIIDPGCYEDNEKKELSDFINKTDLNPVRLINTHSHIDHVFGNKYVADTYGLVPEMHYDEFDGLKAVPNYGMTMGLLVEPSPDPETLPEGGKLKFGNSSLEILYTPGHSIGSLSFYSEADEFVIAGDTLFKGSIGRTDLPGGHMGTLMNSIRNKLLTLGNDVVVYPGHGDPTKIGDEIVSNPFLNGTF